MQLPVLVLSSSPNVPPAEDAPSSPERSDGTSAHGEHSLGLLVAEARVLCVDMRVGAGG